MTKLQENSAFIIFICVVTAILATTKQWGNAQTLLLFCIFAQLMMISEKLK